DPVRVPEIARAVLGVERVHFERRRVDEMARPDESVEQLMLAQDMADVLAEKALDALAEFLHALDVHLGHAPAAVRRVRRPRPDPRDAFLRAKVPRDVR